VRGKTGSSITKVIFNARPKSVIWSGRNQKKKGVSVITPSRVPSGEDERRMVSGGRGIVTPGNSWKTKSNGRKTRNVTEDG